VFIVKIVSIDKLRLVVLVRLLAELVLVVSKILDTPFASPKFDITQAITENAANKCKQND